METQPVVPSLEKSSRPWRRAVGQSIVVHDSDRGLLEHGLNIYQLASESARRVLLPTSSHRITVVLKDLAVELRSLVSSGRVGAARALLGEVDGGEQLRWAKVLELPTTSTKAKTGRSDFSRNAEWIRKNRESFVGIWVALVDGQLVDHDKSRLALHRRLETTGKLVKGTLFTKVD